jgi:hypothetical protein
MPNKQFQIKSNNSKQQQQQQRQQQNKHKCSKLSCYNQQQYSDQHTYLSVVELDGLMFSLAEATHLVVVVSSSSWSVDR